MTQKYSKKFCLYMYIIKSVYKYTREVPYTSITFSSKIAYTSIKIFVFEKNMFSCIF